MPSREERKYIVWGILIAGLFGFLINIFANLAYGFFIIGDLSWAKINHFNFLLSVASLIGIVGYLMFFINDYPNTLELSKAYWKRYQHYFLYQFWPGKIMGIIVLVYLILLFLGLLSILYYIFARQFGYPITSIAIIIVFIFAYISEKRKKHAQ